MGEVVPRHHLKTHVFANSNFSHHWDLQTPNSHEKDIWTDKLNGFAWLFALAPQSGLERVSLTTPGQPYPQGLQLIH